jgi:hypothetical protein
MRRKLTVCDTGAFGGSDRRGTGNPNGHGHVEPDADDSTDADPSAYRSHGAR